MDILTLLAKLLIWVIFRCLISMDILTLLTKLSIWVTFHSLISKNIMTPFVKWQSGSYSLQGNGRKMWPRLAFSHIVSLFYFNKEYILGFSALRTIPPLFRPTLFNWIFSITLCRNTDKYKLQAVLHTMWNALEVQSSWILDFSFTPS